MGGNPARVIKYRFNENIRKKLGSIKLESVFENAKSTGHFELLHTILNEENIDNIVE